jgi:hypothetical protein
MAKKRSMSLSEFLAEQEERHAETTRLLEELVGYHREERAVRARRFKRLRELLAGHEKRFAETTKLLEERIACHRAKIAEERAARGETA